MITSAAVAARALLACTRRVSRNSSFFTLHSSFPLTLQRYGNSRALPNFSLRFDVIFSTNLADFDGIRHRRCSRLAKPDASIALPSLNRIFGRAVTHEARIRNFRPSKVTSRRFRAGMVPASDASRVPTSHRPIKVVVNVQNRLYNSYNNIIILIIISLVSR